MQVMFLRNLSFFLNENNLLLAQHDRVDAETLMNGSTNPISCMEKGCVDGVVLRGNFTQFTVEADKCSNTTIPWNALELQVKEAVEQCGNGSRQVSLSPLQRIVSIAQRGSVISIKQVRAVIKVKSNPLQLLLASPNPSSRMRQVDVTRSVLDRYGTMEWDITFTMNPGLIPPGAGNVRTLLVTQDLTNSSEYTMQPRVTETQQGSAGLSGTFTLDYNDVGGSRYEIYS